VQDFYGKAALAYFLVATISLMLIAGVLLVKAILDVALALPSAELVNEALDSVGLLIIGFAVIETAKFIAEEEILRKRELRSSMESRRSITKFVTIIVIAASLEALVMVFRSSHDTPSDVIYASALFSAAMFALIALGSYQWLSSRIEPPSEHEKREAQPDEKTV
jgi:hypothetical protein